MVAPPQLENGQYFPHGGFYLHGLHYEDRINQKARTCLGDGPDGPHELGRLEEKEGAEPLRLQIHDQSIGLPAKVLLVVDVHCEVTHRIDNDSAWVNFFDD